MNAEKACAFYYRSGSCDDISDVLEKANGEEPMYYWLDPRTVFQESENGLPVFGGGMPRINDYPVNELRLFWGNHALHAVFMGSGQWHWFEYSEEKQAGDDWQKLDLVTKEDPQPVLLRKQWASENVAIVNYHYRNRLIAWRLEPGVEENQDERYS